MSVRLNEIFGSMAVVGCGRYLMVASGMRRMMIFRKRLIACMK